MDSSRTEILVGKEGMKRLSGACVAVFGLGGVGGYAAEALVRSGIGRLVLVDYDDVSPSNLNRQILALQSSIGRPKTEVAEKRFRDINPDLEIRSYRMRIASDNAADVLADNITHVIDAIDEVEAKVGLITALHRSGTSFVSSMGAGSKLDPSGIRLADIRDTRHCPLARVVRHRLRKNGIHSGVRCLYSEENLRRFEHGASGSPRKAVLQGTVSYMTGMFGLYAAGVIIRDILAV
jgi:tRNA A37 threonylcarbamoyladenosine dehydratase